MNRWAMLDATLTILIGGAVVWGAAWLIAKVWL